MSQARRVLDKSRLVIEPLVPGTSPGVEKFSCGDSDLDDFIRNDAARLQSHNTTRTFLGYYEECLVGFVALMNDAISTQTPERKKLALTHADHPIVPAIKVARLGVCTQFRAEWHGCGEGLMRFAVVTALLVSRQSGCRLLTVDAYPDAVSFYERLGFQPNGAPCYREKVNRSMRMDVHSKELPKWVF